MITASGTAGTCRASTCRSGSAIVTMAPMRKQMTATAISFHLPPSLRPICSPMGIMAMSAPREKNPIPTMSIAAPNRKSSSVPIGIGARVKLSKSTITVIGRTDESASEIFSFSFFRIDAPRFRSQVFPASRSTSPRSPQIPISVHLPSFENAAASPYSGRGRMRRSSLSCLV